MTLTHSRLLDVLNYNPDTGYFTWKKELSLRGRVGAQAGCEQENRISIRIDGSQYLAHRLAWFYMTGSWPSDNIDHKNLVGTDNRYRNLRLANHSQNGANTRAHKDNKLGVKGVTFDTRRRKYVAQLTVNGRRVLRKRFNTVTEAAEAYAKAAGRYFGDYGRAA